MPVETYWIVPNRVKLMKFVGHYTIEEISTLNTINIEWMQNSNAPYHLIVDLKESTDNPPVSESKKLGEELAKQSNFGWNIIINDMNPIMRLPATLFLQLTQKNYKMVKDLDIAIKFLQEMDNTLPQNMRALAQPIKTYAIN